MKTLKTKTREASLNQNYTSSCNQSKKIIKIMDSTSPSHRSDPRSGSKSASRLARIRDLIGEGEGLPVDVVPSPPKRAPTPPYLCLQTSNRLPLQEMLPLSPSPRRRSKTRHLERTEMAEEPIDPAWSRRRCKSKAASMALLGCPSPRNSRRARRRLEQENREEREVGLGDEVGKARKRRHSGRSRREKLSLVPSVPSSSISPKSSDEDHSSLDRIGQQMFDLIMWEDVAKSSLWFGFGFLCLLSSCFTRGLCFSIFSVVSHLGLLFLGISFCCKSLSQGDNDPKKKDFKLREGDIVRAARVVLPAANLVIARIRLVFSGEPSMTLKVAPFLLFGSEYGHFMTLRRLFAIGFFLSFTAPKLYSCYSEQINKKVEYLGSWAWEAWGACSHKKIVAASAVTVFWNLSSIKTRLFAAFICIVIFRHNKQHLQAEVVEEEGEGEQRQQQQWALVVAEEGSPK